MLLFNVWKTKNPLEKQTSSQNSTTVSLSKRHFLLIIVCLGVILLVSVANLVQITLLGNNFHVLVSHPDPVPDYVVLPPEDLKVVPRERWVAQPQAGPYDPLPLPVPYVIIHHTATEPCSTLGECVLHVRSIQDFHITSRNWSDIGYHFLVGGDGLAYTGRGWNGAGAHTKGYNTKSIGIAFVGTFEAVNAPEGQISACKKLINFGVQKGYIAEDYKVLGARQVAAVASPGIMLYEEMQTWPHWVLTP